MNLVSEERHFVRWSKRVGTPVASSDFVARRAFGDYVEDTFIETIGSAASRDVDIDIKTYTPVVDVACQPNGFCVALGNGQLVQCNAVVLATGLPLPSDPLEPWLSPDSARYLRNPWHQESFDSISVDERVLLLGTGLTMIDVALLLDCRGHHRPIAALSRRGLLPRAHCEPVQELSSDLRMSLQASMAGGNLRQILRTVRRTVRAASERGQSCHAVMDAMRPVTSTAWAFGSSGIVPHLFLMGPACRPWNFEHIAVPELRRQADMLAARLLNRGFKGQRSVAKVLPFGRRRKETVS